MKFVKFTPNVTSPEKKNKKKESTRRYVHSNPPNRGMEISLSGPELSLFLLPFQPSPPPVVRFSVSIPKDDDNRLTGWSACPRERTGAQHEPVRVWTHALSLVHTHGATVVAHAPMPGAFFHFFIAHGCRGGPGKVLAAGTRSARPTRAGERRRERGSARVHALFTPVKKNRPWGAARPGEGGEGLRFDRIRFQKTVGALYFLWRCGRALSRPGSRGPGWRCLVGLSRYRGAGCVNCIVRDPFDSLVPTDTSFSGHETVQP